jgi:hypothetical protein
MSSGLGNDHRHRPPLVLRIRHHGEHRINPSRTQQPFANGSRNAGPLRAVHRRAHARAHHPPERSEVQLVLPARVARTAMHTFFHGRIVRLDELARLAAAARIRTARHPTIGAQLAQRPCTDFWRIKTTGSRPAIKFSEPERDGTPFHTQQQR